MSQCPCHCSTYTKEAKVELHAQAQEQASIRACQWSSLPYLDLDLLDPLPLAFSCKEAPYKDASEQRGDPKLEQTDYSSPQRV